MPDFYTTTYRRALHAYHGSGFLTRALDADDIALIEQIRERGCLSTGSLGDLTPTPIFTRRWCLEEEVEFWRRPAEFGAYDRAQNILRTAVRTADAVVFSEHTKESRARKHLREAQDKAMAAAELARAEAEWKAQQEALAEERKQREARMRQSDLEWEQAEEASIRLRNTQRQINDAIKSGALKRKSGRHYVPQWRLAEEFAEAKLKQKKERDARAALLRKIRTARKDKVREELERAELSAQVRAAIDEARARRKEREAAKEATIESYSARKWEPAPAPPARLWAELGWWPVYKPFPHRMFIFENTHCFIRDDDIDYVMTSTDWGPRLRLVEQRDGLSHFEATDGKPIPQRG